MKSKKFIALLLVLVMAACLLPTSAFAASSGGAGGMDALSAIGIDASKAPDDYDQNAKNPYGKQTTTLNPVSELYMVGLKEITTDKLEPSTKFDGRERGTTIEETPANTLRGLLWGHEVWGKDNAGGVFTEGAALKTIASGTSEIKGYYEGLYAYQDYFATKDGYLYNMDVTTSLSSTGTGSFELALSTVAAGNFDGNQDGKAAQAVLLYTSKQSRNGGIYFSVGDVISGEYGNSKELISKTALIGNPHSASDGGIYETPEKDPYLLQNYLQAATGDFDGDGRDEIAVYVPEYGSSRIEIYKLITTTGQGNKPYLNPDNWRLEWTYSLKESSYVSNMVSMVTGDFNRDGVDDLAVTWGYYNTPLAKDNTSRAAVMFGSASKMLQNAQEFPLTYGSSDITRASFAYGDLLGTGSDVLVLGGQLTSDLTGNYYNTRYVAVYEWDGASFVTNDNLCKNFNLFAKDKDNKWVYPAMSRSEAGVSLIERYIFYSSPLCVANLAVVRQGPGKNASLYFDSLLIEYSDAGLDIVYTYDNKARMQNNVDAPVPYVEYGAVSGDLVGAGEDSLATMWQTFSSEQTHEVQSTVSSYTFYRTAEKYYSNWWKEYLGVSSFRSDLDAITPLQPTTITDTLIEYTPGVTNRTVHYKMDDGYSNYYRYIVDVSSSLCMPRTDDDTAYLNYNNNHYYVYSDPNVLAVLASPPYFGDLLDRDDLSGNYAESTTSYSTSKGSGGAITASATISAGVYVKVEQEFSFFGIKAAQAESETTITAAFTYDYEHSTGLEQTVTYSAAAGEDMIALYSIPVEVFEFTAYIPDGAGGYSEQLMTVNIPHTAAIKLIALDEYERVAADYRGILPQISGSILTHTIGDPASYPSSTNGYRKALSYSGTPAAVGFSGTAGGAAISQEIAMTSEESNSFSASAAIETKVGAGAGGVTVGVTLGAEAGAGYVTTTTSGSSFSGELQNMPIEAQSYGYYHNWRVFAFEYSDGKLQFPVVSYLVNDVSAPPSLPEDFAQDISGTTSDQIALTWSYGAGKTIGGFRLYRYYEFPDGSGSYELAFVPYSTGVYNSVDGLMHFTFTDTGLNPYTEYKYQIQSVRAAVPTQSIFSEAMGARTKTDRGYPLITLSGLTEEGALPIYPDTPSTVTVTVKDADTGNSPTNLNYQWQKYSGSRWTDIGGQTGDRLTFSVAGADDEALYRCRINTIYFDQIGGDTYYISAYSDIFPTKYYKRNAETAGNGFTALPITGNGLKLSLELRSADYNHGVAPTGEVIFTVTGTDYKSSFTAELAAGTTPINGKYHSTAAHTINTLPEGIYEITAFYGGSRIFKTFVCDETETALIGNTSGYQLTLSAGGARSTAFTYGDNISAALEKLEQGESGARITPIAEGVTFKLVDGGDVSSLFDSPAKGGYTLEAWLEGSKVAERVFTVAPRKITIAQVNHEVSAGAVSYNPPQNFIKLSEDTPMAFVETPGDLKLTFIATNSAGSVTAINDSTLPGNYTVLPCASADTPEGINNYEITFVPGVYTVAGPKYQVTYNAEQLGGITAGTLMLTNTSSEANRFSASTELLFVASPYRGYAVDTWTVKTAGGQTARTQKGGNQFTYTMLSENITVSVTFTRYSATLSAIVRGGMGEITSDIASFESGDPVNPGAEITFKATPDNGYHFVRWIKYEGSPTGVEYTGSATLDGGNELLITMGNFDITLYAEFARDSYTLTLSGDLEAAYTYKDAQGNDIDRTAGSGASIVGDTQVTIRPKAGYQVPPDALWNITGADNTTQPGDPKFVFTMLSDTSVAVDTANQTYTVNVSCDAAEGGAAFTVNGGESQTGEVTGVAGGSRVVLTATPMHGYVFKSWTVNGNSGYSTERVLAIAQLGGNIEAVAVFEPNVSYTASISLNTPRAKIVYTLKDALDNTVLTDEPYTGDITVYEGDTLTFKIIPDSEFMVEKWTINGKVNDTGAKTYSFAAIDGNIDVGVDIISQTNKTVHYSAGPNGDLTATSDGRSFDSGDTQVGGGTTVIFTASPVSGYMVEQWIVNDKVVLNEYGEPLVDSEYIIDGLVKNITVKVTFTEISGKTYMVDVDADNATWLVTYTPAFGTDELRDGAAAIFTFTPDNGYELTGAEVNGTDFDNVTKKPDGTWVCIVYNVTEDLEVIVTADIIPAKGTDASLRALSIDEAPLNESFAPDLFSYTSSVSAGTTQITVNATPADPNASISIIGANSLTVGVNTISIVVTAEDGVSSETYTITVTVGAAATSYNVTFMNGSTICATKTVTTPATTVDSLPAEPANGSYTFSGWYTGANGSGTQFTTSTPVTTNMTVYAYWTGGSTGNGPGGSGSSGGAATQPTADPSTVIGGYTVTTPESKPPVKNDDGTTTLPGGGTIETESGTKIEAPEGTVIDKDGTITIPIGKDAKVILSGGVEISVPGGSTIDKNGKVTIGEGGGNVSFGSGDSISLEGGTVIILDEDIPIGYYVAFNNPFIDVKSGDWFYDNVSFVYSHDLFMGTSATLFSPGAPMTRAMFATVLARLDGADLSAYKTSRFSDVEPGQWYAAAVEWAADKGIVSGVGEGKFNPNAKITREQMAAMLYNYMQYKGYNIPATGAAAFADETDISPWALEAVRAMQAMGIINGKPGNRFDPQGIATRAEVATIFTRFMEPLQK